MVIKGWPELWACAIIFLLLSGGLMLIAFTVDDDCKKFGDRLGVESYFNQGCYVKIDGRWVNKERL